MKTTHNSSGSVELSVVMPCLNEALTIGSCIESALKAVQSAEIQAEIIIADNGSTDGSQAIGRSLGARVIDVSQKGYGNALRAGIQASRGIYVLFADSDGSYDFGAIPDFIEPLRSGSELVIGNRFLGGISPGAMPFLHRYLGNPVLSFLGRVFFDSKIGDFHCGIRAFSRDAIRKLDLRSGGMEFATEMIAKAEREKLRITEIPTTLSQDGRDRPPHLNTWRDGWRHLKFMLQYTPRWLFFYPGCLLFLIGWTGIGLLYFFRPLYVSGINFDIHTIVYCHLAVIVGLQSILYFLLCRAAAVSSGFLKYDSTLSKLNGYLSSERGMLLGAISGVGGCVLLFNAILMWSGTSFGNLTPRETMRTVLLGGTLLVTGIEIVFFFFFSSLLELHRDEKSCVDVGYSEIE